MTILSLAKELCRRDGKKKQVDIAQMKEILGMLSDIFWSEPMGVVRLVQIFVESGMKRAKKKKKVK